MMIESARISRGQIYNLAEINPKHYDALIIPGGWGIAKNYSDFAKNPTKKMILWFINENLNLYREISKIYYYSYKNK